ncbi:MAG TPA: histidine kinase [Sphaerochaeta sp.]|jgi:GAF domain-containing protein|nr:histidine kinase [Sphaerochaeta sp.]
MSALYSEGTLLDQVETLVGPWEHSIERRYCHLANVSALLWNHFEHINWVGFYVRQPGEDHLILGPFQGKVACTDIAFSRGVCGKAARTKESQRIADVHLFPGHIACDEESRSELVVPIVDKDATLVALLDVDSPKKDRFTEEDQKVLESVAMMLGERLWS